MKCTEIQNFDDVMSYPPGKTVDIFLPFNVFPRETGQNKRNIMWEHGIHYYHVLSTLLQQLKYHSMCFSWIQKTRQIEESTVCTIFSKSCTREKSWKTNKFVRTNTLVRNLIHFILFRDHHNNLLKHCTYYISLQCIPLLKFATFHESNKQICENQHIHIL